jgi:hypothetical protein
MKTQTVYVHDHLNVWDTPRLELHDDAMVFIAILAWVLIGQAVFILVGGMKHTPKPLLTFICGPGTWLIALWKRDKMKDTITPPPLPKEAWKQPFSRN